MTAGIKDIIIEQGATFRYSLIWKDSDNLPIDITGYTARMQVRKSFNSNDPLLSLTTENGGIALGGILGTIVVTATATLTAAIDVRAGVYDLELQSASGVVTRLVEGKVTINPEVTR
jgi:hypothetical protein